MGWLSSRAATSAVVLIVCVSFLGLFTMQADYYRTLERGEVADAVSGLVTQVDMLTCEAQLEVNWTSDSTSHGLPRHLHGEPYVVRFTPDRAYVVQGGHQVAGQYFPSTVGLLDARGEPASLLEVPSTTGFVVSSHAEWAEWGLDHVIVIQPLPFS